MTQTMSSSKDSSASSGSSSGNVFKDLNMTQDEISRFSEAFKKEEFRKLFREYVDELQNPEQRALYEKEIAQLEQERGMDVEFIHPKPGHVLKLTEADGKKVFINICTSDKIQVATVQRSEKNGKSGVNWSIPHSFSPPREDTDKAKQTCLVIDAVFHPDTYLMASRNAQFKKMLEDTAVQGAEKNFQLKFAAGGSIRRPKIDFKGLPQATVIRRKRADFDTKQAQLKSDPPNPFVQHYNNAQAGETKTEGREFELEDSAKSTEGNVQQQEKIKIDQDSPKTPKYQLKYSYRSDFGDFAYESPSDSTGSVTIGPSAKQPSSIQVLIELPGVSTAQAIDVDVEDRQLRVSCQRPVAYKLELRLPCAVTEDNGSAKFDRKTHLLTLVLPCISRPEQPLQRQQQQAAPLIQELPDAPASSAGADAKEHSTVAEHPQPQSEFRAGRLPGSIQCRQTDGHVTLLVGVKNISAETVQPVDNLPASSGCRWAVSFASVGAGGWRSNYSLAVMQPESSALEFETLQIGPDNLVVRLAKPRKDTWLDELTLQAQPALARAASAVDAANLQFFNMPNPSRRLADCLARYAAPASPAPVVLPPAGGCSVPTSGLVVTELCADRLTVRLDGQGEDVRDKLVVPPPSVQQQQQQQQQASQSRLQGILKFTRSPSLSSSDDLSSSLSSSQSQQQQPQHLLLNRSVSFSDHVESANYSINASISAFHHTLRNRKKRQKQRETRRRRHNSDTSAAAAADAPASAAGGKGAAGRVRRISEGCSSSSASYAKDGIDDDDDDDNDGEDCETGDIVDLDDSEVVAAAAAAVSAAAETPLSPPPPTMPGSASGSFSRSKISSSLVGSVSQLTSSVIFELDDD